MSTTSVSMISPLFVPSSSRISFGTSTVFTNPPYIASSRSRLDEYAESIDSVRVTPYGRYLYSTLSSAFTYIDLVSTDTAVFDSRVSAELANLAMEEYYLWETGYADPAKRRERVEKRITKAHEFVDYLCNEEEREAELYGLTPEERFTPQIAADLDDEIERVRRSADRQIYRAR